MTSTEQATRSPGSWVNLNGAVYQIDQLGEIGTCIAYARHERVAASMVEAHNSMLAALKDVREWLGVDLFSNHDVYQARAAKSISAIEAAITKAEGF